VVGAGKALSLGVNPIIAVAMGVLTASFGGVIRDVLAAQPSALLKREISISAALLAAGGFVALNALGVDPIWAGVAGAAAGFALRAGAIRYGWALPAFGARSDRRDG
jgi:uncharacterized membrane protein YeiH